MISRTKFEIDETALKKLFESAGIKNASEIAPLGAGEYNAVFSAKADGKEYAVKIAPQESVPILTYEKNIMQSEIFWYGKMRENTDIKVPEIYFTDFCRKIIPTDFFIMEKLRGVQLDKAEFAQNEKNNVAEQMAKMAAQIHKIKNDKFGYIQNGLHDDWYEAVKAMTSALVADCETKGRKTARGKKLLEYIEIHKEILKKAECSMVNFDLWAPNVICSEKDGKTEFAWIDPERSFWGDRIADFVCLEMFLPLEKKKASLAAYNAVAEKPVEATEEEKIRYAVAQGYLGLIMEIEKYYRYSVGNFGWWRNVIASAWLFKNAFKTLNYNGK